MSRALVTGGAGFVGRHITQRLLADGYDVTTVDVRPYGAERHTHIIQDVRSFFSFTTSRFDLIVHCAAVVGGRAFIDGEPLAVATDLSIDSELFGWAVRTRQPRVVYYSSSAAYPVGMQRDNSCYSLYESDIKISRRDADELGRPDMTYGWAKLTGEYLAQFARDKGVMVHVLRPFSGYGVGQSLAYPMTALCERALNREDPFDVWCSPQQTRDWIHIRDIVDATLAVVAADEQRPVNVCTGVPVEFEELVTSILALTGHAPDKVRYRNDRPSGVHYRVGSPRRMLEYHTPRITLGAGIGDLLDHMTKTEEREWVTD